MPKYLVTVGRDLSEYVDVTVEADDFDAAEEKAVERVTANPGAFQWREGDDREGVFAVDSEEVS